MKKMKVSNFTGRIFFFLLIAAFALSLCLCLYSCDDDAEPEEYMPNKISVQNGFLSTGKTVDTVEYGTPLTVYALELPGMYFSHWTKNGERIEGGEVLSITADLQSASEVGEILYLANYDLSPYAGLEDVPRGSFESIVSDRYTFNFSSSSDDVFVRVSSSPDDIRNNVIKYEDSDPDGFGEITMGIAAREGNFLVYSMKFYIESFLGSVPLSFSTGNYNIDLYASGDALKVCDEANGTTAYLKAFVDVGKWHEMKICISNKSDGDDYPVAYVFLDGECIAKSHNVASYSYSGAVSVSTSGQGELVAYFDNITAHNTLMSEAEQTAIIPAFTVEKGHINQDAYYQAEILLDADALAALKAMDQALFSENIYRWIAELYDPETSAIYFSISGRDNYGYLPDIETVAQGYGILSTLGLGSSSTLLNDEQKANLLSWIQTLQSNRDGYYYHPQWGVSINNSRLSRDLGNSASSYSPSGSLAYRLFDDANYRLSDGLSGNRGVTVPSAYDNSLTVMLSSSKAAAVSKLLMTSSMSSMPQHLRSEENLVRHINDRWNSTCTRSGTHERHFCTDSCVIVEDLSDSYMRIIGGKLVIARGYRCTSCHECSHTLGHSYGFGHYVTSMGSQIKAAGLGTPTVMYFYDIQENVQAALRDKAEKNYIAENGQSAWDELSSEDQTEIRRSAENGIWEEKVTYNTISGLLKISGIPGTHGYEFLYAEQAINSAIDGALFSTEDFIARREAIVSIYNPFNAINGIMNNVTSYGSDQSVKTEAMAVVRRRAKELIDNTATKLACYLMPDGGYSYSMSGYCVSSQGQPVAVNGWGGGVGEGDVNGTALALGTRSALVSCLGLSIGAPFSGVRALYSEEGYDLDCNGVIEGEELTATHADVFKSLIRNKSEIQKIDSVTVGATYDFEGADPVLPSSGKPVKDGDNGVLEVTDSRSDSGLYTSFIAGKFSDTEAKTKIKLDMKVIDSNNTVTHQLFAGTSNTLYINFTYSQGSFTFDNKHSVYQALCDITTGERISVNAKEWFSLDIEVYISGRSLAGQTKYGIFKVTQGGVTQTAYLDGLNSYKLIDDLDMYSLNSAKNTVYYDNVSCYTSVVPGVFDGEYHFDTVDQEITSTLTSSPTNKSDRVYPISQGEKASFTPDDYSAYYVIYNFDFFSGQLYLGDANPGDRVYYTFKDSSGKRITGVYLEVNNDETVTVYAINGQKLRMANPARKTSTDPAIVDMTLALDKSKWLTVKLEYHYDLDEPQFDAVVRYADRTYNSYNRTVASTLTSVTTADNGANARNFTSFDIEYVSDSTSKIYIDDLYIRNVYTQ